MKKYIQNLKSKPEAERKHIAYIATGFCMVIVGSIWLYGLTGHFVADDVGTQLKNDTKPFSILMNSLKGGFNDVTASVNRAKVISGDSAESTTPQGENIIELIPVEKQIQ